MRKALSYRSSRSQFARTASLTRAANVRRYNPRGGFRF